MMLCFLFFGCYNKECLSGFIKNNNYIIKYFFGKEDMIFSLGKIKL